MASSWGDSRVTYRLGRFEVWVEHEELDVMWAEQVEMVRELQHRAEILSLPKSDFAFEPHRAPSPA